MAAAYKRFSIAFDESEYERAKAFFEKFGGFSKFVKREMVKEGYGDSDLLKAARKIKEASKKEYSELEGTLGDGLQTR